jgi:hypothetical protein
MYVPGTIDVTPPLSCRTLLRIFCEPRAAASHITDSATNFHLPREHGTGSGRERKVLYPDRERTPWSAVGQGCDIPDDRLTALDLIDCSTRALICFGRGKSWNCWNCGLFRPGERVR